VTKAEESLRNIVADVSVKKLILSAMPSSASKQHCFYYELGTSHISEKKAHANEHIYQ